jgi:hypothetical protein
MAELETAEEFALEIHEGCHYGCEFDRDGCAELIEADRKAVALRAKRELLDEIGEHLAAAYHGGDWVRRIEALLRVLRDKYQEKP